MPFGLFNPPRTASATDPKRARRLAAAMAGSTGGNFRSIKAELRGGEFVEIVTTKDNKRLFKAHHLTLGSVEMTVGSLTGGQITTDNGTLTTFLTNSNGTQWKYRTNGLGITFSMTGVAQAIQCTAGGITVNLDGFANGQLQDGDWLFIYDEDANAAASPIEIAPDSGEGHTINGSASSIYITENHAGYLIIFDGTGDWMAFKMSNGSQTTTVASRTETANYTADGGDHTILVQTSVANLTVTLPPAASFPNQIYVIKKIDANAFLVIIDGDGSEVIDGATTYSLGSQYDSVMIQSLGGAWSILCSHP